MSTLQNFVNFQQPAIGAPWLNSVDLGFIRQVSSVSGTNTILGISSPTTNVYVAGINYMFTPLGANTGAVTVDFGAGPVPVVDPLGNAMLGAEFQPTCPAMLVVAPGGASMIFLNPNPSVGTFTANLTGFASPIPVNFNFVKFGRRAFIQSAAVGAITGTSTTNSMTLTDIPSYLAPALGASGFLGVASPTLIDVGASRAGTAFFSSSTVITYQLLTVSGSAVLVGSNAFSATGLKGFTAGSSYNWVTAN